MWTFLSRLTANWKLKLAAFTLAVLLWVTVSADQTAVRTFTLEVEVAVRDPNVELVAGPAPDEVQVRLSGAGRDFWGFALGQPRVRIPVTSASEGMQAFVIEPYMVQLRGRNLAVLDIRPSTVQLTFQRLASREVPVRLQVRRGVGEGFALIDTLEVRPARVRVSGATGRVNAVDEVITEPLDLPRDPGPFSASIPLDTTNLTDLRFAPGEVEVVGRVDRAVERVIADVPVTTPPGVIAVPATVNLRVRGAETVLARLSTANVQVAVPPEAVVGPLPPIGMEVGVRVERLPVGVSALEIDPQRVRIMSAPVAPTLAPTAPPGAPGPPDTVPAAGPPP